MMRLFEFLSQKIMVVATYILALLVVLNAIGIFYFQTKVSNFDKLTAQAHSIQKKSERLRGMAYYVDTQARDYVVSGDKAVLDKYKTNFELLFKHFDSLKSELKKYNYADTTVTALESKIASSITIHKNFISNINDSTSLHTNYVHLHSARVVNAALANLRSRDEELLMQNQKDTAMLSGWILTLQVVMLVLVVPLIFLIAGYRKSRAKLKALTREIDESNRKYVFNSMEDVDLTNEEAVKASLIANLGRATDFIQRITNGDYSVRWEGMNDANRHLNKGNIAGELLRMREQMKQVKEEDRMRMWTTEGLSKFSDIIRMNQSNFSALSDILISNAVKYLDAKVGGLYILEQDEASGESYLQLNACYAYNKKKFITKKIGLGEGLIGQAYMEGHTIYLQQVPKDYMSITSGLGEATPKSVIMIPLKVNEKIEGVLELASLKDFQPYEIAFLEKLGETLAASIISIRTGEKTKYLLNISQEQSEEMRAQEEEMRQNMEELEATQDQMARQVQELNALKESLEKEKYLFGSLMDNIPDMIYFKDEQCRLIRVSKNMVKAFGGAEEQLLGKSDFDFHDEAHAREAYQDEQTIMKTRKPKIDFLEKETREDGTEVWVSTTKMPLVDSYGNVVGTFGISRDVSAFKRLEIDILNKDKRLDAEMKLYEEKIRSLEQALTKKEEEIKALKK